MKYYLSLYQVGIKDIILGQLGTMEDVVKNAIVSW
jgi:hypothetical protein